MILQFSNTFFSSTNSNNFITEEKASRGRERAERGRKAGGEESRFCSLSILTYPVLLGETEARSLLSSSFPPGFLSALSTEGAGSALKG